MDKAISAAVVVNVRTEFTNLYRVSVFTSIVGYNIAVSLSVNKNNYYTENTTGIFGICDQKTRRVSRGVSPP